MNGTLVAAYQLDRGFRFIRGDDGVDYFSLCKHFVDFDGGDSDTFRSTHGTEVQFDVVPGPKGKLRAINVERRVTGGPNRRTRREAIQR